MPKAVTLTTFSFLCKCPGFPCRWNVLSPKLKLKMIYIFMSIIMPFFCGMRIYNYLGQPSSAVNKMQCIERGTWYGCCSYMLKPLRIRANKSHFVRILHKREIVMPDAFGREHILSFKDSSLVHDEIVKKEPHSFISFSDFRKAILNIGSLGDSERYASLQYTLCFKHSCN